MNENILVIGLDGACFQILMPWMDSGQLPFLKKVRTQGCCSELKSVIPPLTAPAWSTIITGLNPGRHGIFEFLVRIRENTEGIPVCSTLRNGKPLWAYVEECGGNVTVMNVPTTYPPDHVKGVMISGFLTPKGRRDFTYPGSLLKEFEDKFGNFNLYISEVYSPGRVPAILEELNSNLDHRLKVAKYLKEKYPSNLFFLHLWGIDRLQHELWHILDPSHPDFNVKEHREYFPQIVDFYKRIDSALEELAQGFDRILIISDHGFGPITKYLIMNLWLVQEGFLVLEKSAKTSLQNFVFRLGFTPGQIYRLAMRLGFANFRLSQGVGERFKFFHFLENFFLSLGNIDWNKTRAYSKGNFGQIYLNLKAREPFGSIEPGSVEEWEIRGKIVESLRKFKDPETGEKIVGEIFEKESIYHGSFIDMAPEITFLPVNMAYKALGTFEFASNHVIEHAFGNFGDHRMNGILMGMGRGIKQGSSALNARLTDILPTVLWLLGIKDTAFDVDGRILFEIMEDSLKACPKEQSMQRQQYPSGERQSFEPDFSDLNKVRELLKKYGYFV